MGVHLPGSPHELSWSSAHLKPQGLKFTLSLHEKQQRYSQSWWWAVGSHAGRQARANTPQEGAMRLYGKEECGEDQVLCQGRTPEGSKCSYPQINGK